MAELASSLIGALVLGKDKRKKAAIWFFEVINWKKFQYLSKFYR